MFTQFTFASMEAKGHRCPIGNIAEGIMIVVRGL